MDKVPTAARAIGSTAVPAEEGAQVDVDATLRDVMAALQQTDLHETAVVPLTVETIAPPAQAAEADPQALPQVASIQQPLLLRAEPSGLEIALDPARLSQLVTSTNPLQLDAEGMRAYLETFAEQVAVAPRDARLDFDPGDGRRHGAADQPARAQVGRRRHARECSVGTCRGQHAGPACPGRGRPGSGQQSGRRDGDSRAGGLVQTYFAGSSASRVRNIEVAAEKFEGVVVPPDGIFSFNEVVRDVSSANGFEDGLVIWGDRTAVGVGGGVCQVSTTVFRTAYEGGFPIVERYQPRLCGRLVRRAGHGRHHLHAVAWTFNSATTRGRTC